MKTIYVTVAEFLANGGVLEEGRELYDRRNTFKIGTFMSFFADGVKFTTASYIKEIKMAPLEMLYVQIECTPIYK